MQLTPIKGNYIEKILRDAQGHLVRVTFCVYESDGRIKARLIQATLLEQTPAIENKIYSLSGNVAKSPDYSLEKIVWKEIVSPYFNNLLFSIGSKPRAPTK